MNKFNLIFLFVLLFLPLQIFSITSNVSGGINLSFEFNYGGTIEPTLYDITKDLDTPFPSSSDLSANTVTYDGIFNRQSYPYNLSLKIFTSGNPTDVKCSSTNSLIDCIINYDNTYISSLHDLSFQYCTDFGSCGISPRLFPFTQFNNVESIHGGLFLTTQSTFNITDLVIKTPYYITPKENNIKLSNRTSYEVKIYDGNTNLESCTLQVNNTNYTMSYVDHYCTYNYNFNITKVPQDITFKIYYVESGITKTLRDRTIYIYPNSTTIKNIPFMNLYSLIIILLFSIFLN